MLRDQPTLLLIDNLEQVISAGSSLADAAQSHIAPHIASASMETRGKMIQMSIGNLLAGLRGERLPNCVNPEVYKSGSHFGQPTTLFCITLVERHIHNRIYG